MPPDPDEPIKGFGMMRVMSEAEFAELELGPLDHQDRYFARGYEVAPSILALERGQMICGILDGYGPSEHGGTLTLTVRRPTGSMWIIVPLKVAQRCKQLIGTQVVVRRRRDGSYVVEPRRNGMTDSSISQSQVIVDGRVQTVELYRALRCDDALSCRRRAAVRRCSNRCGGRRPAGNRRRAAKKASADPNGEPPRHRRAATNACANSSNDQEPPPQGPSLGRVTTALTREVRR